MARNRVEYSRIEPLGLGLAAGTVLGVCMFITASALKILVLRYGMGHAMVGFMTTIYPGYTLTYIGAAIAGVWTFLKGFVMGGLIAWVYNKLV